MVYQAIVALFSKIIKKVLDIRIMCVIINVNLRKD